MGRSWAASISKIVLSPRAGLVFLKFDVFEKVRCLEATWCRTWPKLGAQKDPKVWKKAIQKSMQKIIPKKDTKCIPKAFQNYAKTDTNKLICHTFAKKAEMLQTACFPIENVVMGIQQLRKVHQKCMQKLCLKKACKK